jgi:hypothetical protein
LIDLLRRPAAEIRQLQDELIARQIALCARWRRSGDRAQRTFSGRLHA